MLCKDYLLELSSEIIPILIGILAIGIKEKKRGLILSLIALSIIEIPALVVTIYCIVMGVPPIN